MAQDKDKKSDIIWVAGTSYPWEKESISYEEVVKIAFPQDTNRNYSVTYEKGHGEKPASSLSPGESVKVKNEMRFYVQHTGES